MFIESILNRIVKSEIKVNQGVILQILLSNQSSRLVKS